ncbi:MAG: type I restriction endonuclease [Methanomicrobiales archaeon]|nr:type I restriction endonuclease [Methanomicrobiales archaeon]
MCEGVVYINSSVQVGNNTFHITDEFSFTNGSKTIHEDVVFFVNGIPAFFVKAKAAHKKRALQKLSTRSGATTANVMSCLPSSSCTRSPISSGTITALPGTCQRKRSILEG